MGICKLCIRDAELKLSHVWSSFLYKDYVADMSKGGKVICVPHNPNAPVRPQDARQVKREWLCHGCEQNFAESEGVIADLLRKIDKKRDAVHRYDSHMLRFVTSISWRVMHLMCESWNRGIIEDEFPASKYWRHFLSKKRPDVAGFSQHVFCLFERKNYVHKMLSGDLRAEEGLMISQAGPLFIVARLARPFANQRDAAIWRRSEISAGTGSIAVLKEWRIGENITRELAEILSIQETKLVKAVRSRHGMLERRNPGRRHSS